MICLTACQTGAKSIMGRWVQIGAHSECFLFRLNELDVCVVICVASQAWRRLSGTVTSLSSRQSTNSCLSSDSTRHPDSVLSQVTHDTSCCCFSCMLQVSNCASSSTGNSVHADKKFLDKFMPQFMRHLHYRIIDVSTIKELSRFVPHLGFYQIPKRQLLPH